MFYVNELLAHIVVRTDDSAQDRQAFAIAGPSAWNSLPDPDRNPNATEAAFRRLLRTFLFARY